MHRSLIQTWFNISCATCNKHMQKEIAHRMLLTLSREPLCLVVKKAQKNLQINGKAQVVVVQTITKRRCSNRTDFELTNFGFTRPRIAPICRMTRDEVPPLLTKISYTTTSTNSTLVQSGFARESRFVARTAAPSAPTGQGGDEKSSLASYSRCSSLVLQRGLRCKLQVPLHSRRTP
ncbi:hypothetical protein D6D01_04944 [Aureobasidium pullulans]|uniref:Uncharacterized protein n=1 Tax=Aureobasidium pullulans TaxID=5580 RepID=A0A4S9L9N1_AURPU|nr:hypothetical protein D6D01_04944 [Aureobasidium pullulans]